MKNRMRRNVSPVLLESQRRRGVCASVFCSFMSQVQRQMWKNGNMRSNRHRKTTISSIFTKWTRSFKRCEFVACWHVVIDIISREVIAWQAARTPEEIITARENMIAALEEANNVMRETGRCQAWFDACEPTIKELCKGVNAQLMVELASAIKYKDMSCIEFFRTGPINCVLACVTLNLLMFCVVKAPRYLVSYPRAASERRQTGMQ